jgi:hypothetical protein
MSHRGTLVALCMSVALMIGCGKKSEKEGGGDPPATPDEGGGANKDVEQDKGGAAPDLSKWDAAGKAKAWQGSWLAKENGTVQAWTVAGDKVQTWDGTEEATFTLIIESACRAGFKNDQGMTYPRPFAAVGGKLRYGAGGYKDGPEAIFCDDSGATYVVDAAGACTRWDEKFGKWEKSAGECGFRKNAEGAEVFFHGDPNSGEWAIEGDAIVPRSSFPTEPVAGDFAAAKAARDAKASK